MEVFISLKGADKIYADSFIAKNLQQEVQNFSYWNLFDIDQSLIGEDSDKIIRASIKRSSASLLLVSEAFLKSDYINNVELPEIFNRKSIDPNYKIIPVFIEECDVSQNTFLKNSQFINSPKTSLSYLKSRSGKDYDSKIAEAQKIFQSLGRGQSKVSKLKNKLLTSLIIFFTVVLFLIYFQNNSANVSDAPELEITEVVSEDVGFINLEEGDCYSYKKPFLAYVLSPDVVDKNVNIDESNLYSLALENSFIGNEIDLKNCEESHQFEVIYSSSSKPLDDNFNAITDGFELFEFCNKKSFYYSGNKFTNMDAYIGFQFNEVDEKYKFLCVSYEYDENYLLINKKKTHKDVQVLGENTLYETSVSNLKIGDCFQHNNAWGLRDYEYSWRINGFTESVEIVNCSENHDYELIAVEQVIIEEDGYLFSGVQLPIEIIETNSSEYLVLKNIEGYEEYNNGVINSIANSQKYISFLDDVTDLTRISFDLMPGESVYAEISRSGNDYWEFVEVTTKENKVSKSVPVLINTAEKYCNSLPIKGVPAYFEKITDSVSWKIDPIIMSSLDDVSINFGCIARLETIGPVVVGGLEKKTPSGGLNYNYASIAQGFRELYNYSLSNLREYYIYENEQNGNNVEIKTLAGLSKGDCFKIDYLINYEKRLDSLWESDWLVPVTSCNFDHTSEVILEFDEPYNDNSYQSFSETCDDFMYYDLQFAEKLTEGNFAYSDFDYENEEYRYSDQRKSLKEKYFNYYYIQNLLDLKTNTFNSICIHWGSINRSNSVYLNVSAFETFEPTSLSISNYYCPETVNKESGAEVVFRYTRGASEIVDLTYLEINGDRVKEINGITGEGSEYADEFISEDIRKFINSVYRGLNPSSIEFLDSPGRGTMTATITDALGNSDSVICSYEIKN